MSAETPATATPPPPRHRHYTVPPATVRLTVDDLTALLPEGAWTGNTADKARELSLPAAEILETNFPRIRLARLRDLLPGCLRIEGLPEWIALPTDRVALAYRPETRRELLPEAGEPAAAPRPEAAAPLPSWKRLLKPTLAPPPAEEATAPAPPPPAPLPLAEQRLASEAEARLQQIFHSEEELSVRQLVALAGALPALQGCALSLGGETVRSPGFPAALDVPPLGAGALELLSQAGASSGLRFHPVVTLYAESGPISLLHRGEYRLLVAHRERGFLPGVREKLAALLDLLAAAPKEPR